jgi:hypothetical protein
VFCHQGLVVLAGVADRQIGDKAVAVARAVEGALADSKTDSPSRPTLLGPISANAPARGQFRPDRRYLGWDFSAEEWVPVSIRSKIQARPSARTFVQLLWRPICTEPWRTVEITAGSLSRDLPTSGGFYLLVSGPRSTSSSGTLEATLAVWADHAADAVRSVIADGLTVRGLEVRHLMSPTSFRPHTLTPFASTDGLTLTYPDPTVIPGL